MNQSVLNKMTMAELLVTMPQSGRLQWIGLRPEKRAELISVESVEALTDKGLQGDHRCLRDGGKRQVSLIQAEHLPVLASITGHDEVLPQWLRRNLLISGINLYALRDRLFRIGDVVLQGTGICAPCSRMETILGDGGYNAMRGHGGINAKVIQGGSINIDDTVTMEPVEK